MFDWDKDGNERYYCQKCDPILKNYVETKKGKK